MRNETKEVVGLNSYFEKEAKQLKRDLGIRTRPVETILKIEEFKRVKTLVNILKDGKND